MKLCIEIERTDLIHGLDGNGSNAIAYWGRLHRNPHGFPSTKPNEHLFLVVEELGDTAETFADKKHWIRHEHLERALVLMMVHEEHCTRVARLLHGAGDTMDADVLVQLAVFGAIRYS